MSISVLVMILGTYTFSFHPNFAEENIFKGGFVSLNAKVFKTLNFFKFRLCLSVKHSRKCLKMNLRRM